MTKASTLLGKISESQFKIGDKVEIDAPEYQKTYKNPERLQDTGEILKVYDQTALVKMSKPNAQYKNGKDQYIDEFPFSALRKSS